MPLLAPPANIPLYWYFVSAVIEAENVADVSAGANTCVKLAVVPLQNPVRPGDADDTDGCPETELQMNDVNPHYNTEFTL